MKVFCDSALLNNTIRSDFIEESQAMRYIVAVIRSRENSLGHCSGLTPAAIHAHAPARHAPCCDRSARAVCDGKDAYGLLHVRLFVIMAHLTDISAGFVGEILDCKFLLCQAREHFVLLIC
jgi:hypothetical protein